MRDLCVCVISMTHALSCTYKHTFVKQFNMTGWASVLTIISIVSADSRALADI